MVCLSECYSFHCIFNPQFSGLHNSMSVECVMFIHGKNKHSHTVCVCSKLFHTAVLFHFHLFILLFALSTLLCSAQLSSALCSIIVVKASGIFGFLLTTSIYKIMNEKKEAKHTQNIWARIYHFENMEEWGRKFISQGRRMSTLEKLHINFIPLQWITIILMIRLNIIYRQSLHFRVPFLPSISNYFKKNMENSTSLGKWIPFFVKSN